VCHLCCVLSCSFAPLWVCVKTLLYSYDSLSLAYVVKLIAALQLLCITGELVSSELVSLVNLACETSALCV
jgi:flagellar biosynthesis protein FliQ